MFQWFFVVILSFGLLRDMTHGNCGGTNCDENSGRSSGSSRCTQTKCYHHHHRRMLDCGIANCNIDKNVLADYCCNCCCNRISSPPSVNDNNDWKGDKSVKTTGCGSSSADCNSKDVDPNSSTEGSESSLDVSSTSDKTSSEIESDCPPCPLPSPYPPPSSQPITSSPQRFNRHDNQPMTSSPQELNRHKNQPMTSGPQQFNRHENTQLLTRNQTLLMLPKGMLIIPSPQLDLLTSGSSLKFKNIQDLYLTTIKPSSGFNEKLPVQNQAIDNFPYVARGAAVHDCCTRCSGASCMARNSNAVLLVANTYNIRRNRRTKCKNYEMAKLMMANIGRDPSRSKRAIQRAVEKKYAAPFNVICSKGDFTYVTHTVEFCEVSTRGTVCYAFRTR